MSVVVAYCSRSDFASIGKCGKWQTNGKGGEAAKSLNIILPMCRSLLVAGALFLGSLCPS